jgi:hypothetical protein
MIDLLKRLGIVADMTNYKPLDVNSQNFVRMSQCGPYTFSARR